MRIFSKIMITNTYNTYSVKTPGFGFAWVRLAQNMRALIFRLTCVVDNFVCIGLDFSRN